MPIAGMSSHTRPVRLSHQGMTRGSHPCRARLPSEPPFPFPEMQASLRQPSPCTPPGQQGKAASTPSEAIWMHSRAVRKHPQ